MSTHDDPDRELDCLTTRSAIENNGSIRVNIPKEILDERDIEPSDDFDVVIRGYSDGRVVIELPESV